MASERQIAANRRNSERSSGPKTEEGKARSRLNATKHGLAGESAEVEAGRSPEFDARRARWAAEQQPVGEEAEWALDRVVAATFRIESCERSIDKLTDAHQRRASLAWDQDRAIEAAAIFARLSKDPILASRQLQATLAGVVLLIEAWLLLAGSLEEDHDWSEGERSTALDLLGVAADLRSGRMLVDAPEGTDSRVFRRELALEEIERLEELRDEAMIPLDDMDRRQAMAGGTALSTKPAKLLLRYERDAWKHYREAMKQVKDSRPTLTSTSVEVAPTPVVVETPRVLGRPPVVASPPSFEDEIRALRAEAEPYRKAVTDELIAMGIVDEDAWLDELERRLEALSDRRGPGVTERTQFSAVEAGRALMG